MTALLQSDAIVYRRGERMLIARGSAEINLSNGQQRKGDVIEVDLNADETDFTTSGPRATPKSSAPRPMAVRKHAPTILIIRAKPGSPFSKVVSKSSMAAIS